MSTSKPSNTLDCNYNGTKLALTVPLTKAQRTKTFEHNGIKVVLTHAKANPNCWKGCFAGSYKRRGIRGTIDQVLIGIDHIDLKLAQDVGNVRRSDHKDVTTEQRFAAHESLLQALQSL